MAIMPKPTGGYLTPKTPCSGCRWDNGLKTSIVCVTCQGMAEGVKEIRQGGREKGKPDKLTGSKPKVTEKAISARISTRKGPNKTESEYGMILKAEFPQCPVIFEGLKLRLETGAVYSPDWIVKRATGEILCVEVKNAGYKFASYGRSKLAYEYAKKEWPMFEFVWAEKSKGQWIIK